MDIQYKKVGNQYILVESYEYFNRKIPRDKHAAVGFVFAFPHIVLISPGFQWDGPSHAIPTENFMRASMIHDALYTLIKGKIYPKSFRKIADQILWELCIADGMSRLRAAYVYRAVRMFGWRHL